MTDMRDLIDLLEARMNVPPLPGLGETPYWVAPLRALTRRLGLGTWSAGGCFAFADTLCKVHGGQRWGVCSFEADPDNADGGDYPVEHAMVKIGNLFYDFRGAWDAPFKSVKTSRQVVMKNAKEDNVFWFEDEFLDDNDFKILKTVLATGALPVKAVKRSR